MRRALPLLLAIAAFIVAALIWIGSSRTAIHAFDRGSALNASPTGLSIAYAYLGRQPGRPVRMLTTPLRANALAPNAIVIRVETSDDVVVTSAQDNDEDDAPKVRLRTPEPLLSASEDDFVRGGGRLILASDDPGGSLQMRNDAGRVATRVFPIWPGIDSLALPVGRGMAPHSLPRGMHTLFTASNDVVVARQSIGAGEVIVVSVPEMFENQNVASDHHLALFAALAGEGRPVYFDELVHHIEADDGALALMNEWRLGPLLVLAGLAALFAFWRNAQRIGPAEDDDGETRSDAVDLVNSLGALYGRSTSAAESIALYHEALARSVAAQTGLRGDALHRRVAALTQETAPPAAGETLTTEVFNRHLNTINTAFRTLERAPRGGHDANHR